MTLTIFSRGSKIIQFFFMGFSIRPRLFIYLAVSASGQRIKLVRGNVLPCVAYSLFCVATDVNHIVIWRRAREGLWVESMKGVQTFLAFS
jgi:hypothetical protein